MSEPLSAVEIEDVLSSIRRLVSEDLRPAAHPPAEAGPGAAGPALILTPALRVVPEAAAAQPPAPGAGPGPAGTSPPIRDVVAQVGAAVAAQGRGQDWEPERGDAAPGPDPLWPDPLWPESAWPESAWPESAGDEAARDGLEPSVQTEGPLPQAGGAAASGQAGDSAWAEVDGDSRSAEVAGGVAGRTRPVDADWMDRAEAEVIAGLEREETVERPFDPPPFDAMQDEAGLSFDEEVLRDLVRDLIREELQGQLGERITRNIRKLVRAEVARAMTLHDLN